ncbi:hypothetical protein PBI_QYRZULA_18 [Mycobacterium phage Qyrzula]|uniref:Uncharacterized protein n=1 Tax=Mycobacterium phage Qyrzula TaxID=373414 RepID=Q19Z68_9CAUD|nr:gp18 [Mycobacterium phage Qyrzula]ABE67438.1 hypothetical protein PBI_QYRZULA_18 [Mycobacterium phage Qyrzula]
MSGDQVRRVVWWARHSRQVQSGSPPLYRILLVASVCAGVVQSFKRTPPNSIAENSPTWYGYALIGVLLFGGITALLGLYMADENKHHATRLNFSLNVELLGLVALQTATIINMAGVIANQIDQGNGWAPSSPSSWYSLGFSLWMWFRIKDIILGIRMLTK